MRARVGDGRGVHIADGSARDLRAVHDAVAVVIEQVEPLGNRAIAFGLRSLNDPVAIRIERCVPRSHRRVAFRRRKPGQHVHVSDKLRRVGEHDAAGRMVPVTVRIHDVAYRHAEPGRDFVLQPSREVAVYRVAHDHALGRDQKHRVVIVVLRAIQLARDVDDAACRLLLRRGYAAQNQHKHDGGSDRSGNSNHCGDLHEGAMVLKSRGRRDTACD